MTDKLVEKLREKSLVEIFLKQLPDAMFSNYGYPNEWNTRTWAVHFNPSQWREIIPRLTALEARNSSALKATLERIKSKLTDKEVGRYYHRQSMMGNRHKRMVDYALGLALEAVNFEIDSLLPQEGVKE